MKRKILTMILIFCTLLVLRTASEAASVRSLVGKDYSTLSQTSFRAYNGNGDGGDNSNYLSDYDDGVLCVHDRSYDHRYGGDYQFYSDKIYYYYDKVYFNRNGTNMGTISYIDKGSNDKSTSDYISDASFLARMFYEGRTDTPLPDSWDLLQEYRLFCLNNMTSGFKRWFDAGSFRYFIHVDSLSYPGNQYNGFGHHNASGMKLYKKCDLYSKFITNLQNDEGELRSTIKNLGYTSEATAINNKQSSKKDFTKNWTITLGTPYYPSDNFYSGVTYKYAFIDSSSDTNIDWDTASELSATLARGSGYGYKRVKLSGAANSNSDADTLVIKCSYLTYTGLAMGFSTGSGQERFLVTGKENTYSSYIAYEFGGTPNVEIQKTVYAVNTDIKNSETADVEPGDTVIFKLLVTNSGSNTSAELTDAIPEGLTLTHIGTQDGANIKWYSRTSWAGKEFNISKDGSFVRYVKCTVNDDATGTLVNTAKVEGDEELNESGDTELEDTASVKVLGYSYTIEKTSNKDYYEYGEKPTFTIKVTNTGATTIKNVQVTDNVPTGLTYNTWSSVDSGWSKNGSNNVFTYSGMITAGDSKEFTITYSINNYSTTDVTKSGTDGTEEVTIAYRELTNTAKITGITNKYDDISILSSISEGNRTISKKIGIYGYVYEITKIADKAQAEPGETITYTITVTNKRFTRIKNIKVTDVVSTEFDSVTLSGTGWSEDSANVYKYSGELGENDSASFKLECKVGEALLKNEDTTIPNRATLTSVSNAIGTNGFGLETGIYDEVSTTIPGYDAVLSKYIKTGSEGTARASMTNDAKKNSPFIVNKGDTITYVIKVENTGSGNFTTLKLEDKIPEQLQVKSISSDWSRNGDIFTYINNDGTLKTLNGKTTAYLEIECEVIASNMYLPNIVNEVTYSEVLNKNNTSVKEILHYGANKEEIRLADLDISGNVWNDANKNGYKQFEDGISGVDVILYDVTKGEKYAQTTTDSNGNYSFNDVIKGKDFVQAEGTTGYYSSEEYKQYYIEFKYNGVVYQSVDTDYDSTEHINSDGTYVADYEIDSNASETTTGRDTFNKSLETISYNLATGNGGTKELTYNKIHNESSLDKSELQTTDSVKISAYSFLDNSDNIQPLWLYDGNILQETDYLQHINLGLYEREEKADLELTTTLDSHAKTLNGQRQISYRPEEYNSSGRIELHQSNLYWTDYYYSISEVYGSETDVGKYKNENGADPETNLEYTFKTKITNKSTGVDAIVNEVAQYYDENFEEAYSSDGVPFTKTLKIDRDDDGIFDDTDYTYESKVGYRVVKYDEKGNDTLGNSIKYDNSIVKLSNQYEDYIHKNDAGSLKNGFEVLYIELPNTVVLKPGETLEIYTTYMIGKDNSNNRLIVNHDYEVVSEINAYSTYFANTNKPSGTVDIDSNPGNLGLKEGIGNVTPGETISNRNYYEDDTRKSIIRLGLSAESSGRKIQGTVWDDGKMGVDANGKYEAGERGVAGVKVQLYEVIKVGTEYFEIPAVKVRKTDASGNPEYEYITDTTDSNGDYELAGFFPGLYIVRFTYGYDRDADLKYNGQDYKSTIYRFDDTNNFEVSNNNRLTIGPSTVQELPFKEDTTDSTDKTKFETAKASEERLSDARDDEQRRLDVMEYSVEMYNKKAEILKGNDSSDKETFVNETEMFADTATFIAKNENTSRSKKADRSEDADVLICLGQIEDGTSYWFESSIDDAEEDKRFLLEKGAIKHSETNGYWREWAEKDSVTEGSKTIKTTTYLRNYVIENVDFGLVLRPENKIELKKYIRQITLESSAGDIIMDLYYDENSDLIENVSKGFENVQALNNTDTHQGFRYLNVDEELLQGAKIGIKYGFVAINNSDKDYISSNLYGTASEIQSTTTPLTTEGVNTAILNAIVDSTLDKKHENNYYGNYLGNWYYKGGTPGPNDVEATIKIDNILDYVDNSLVFSSVDNDGKWGTILADELNTKGYLKKDVYILDGSTPPIKIIADCNNVEFQTENKNNLAITIDYVSSPMFKHLLTEDNGNAENRAETELYVSTFLSAENESDDMVYENIAEIIKFTTLTGRRTISASDISERGLTNTKAQTVGNAKVNLVGYINSDTIGGTLSEPDTSITEKVMLTPPTGADWIDTYVLTRVIIYVVGSIVVIVLGILFIPKLVTKIKNRKFIK